MDTTIFMIKKGRIWPAGFLVDVKKEPFVAPNRISVYAFKSGNGSSSAWCIPNVKVLLTEFVCLKSRFFVARFVGPMRVFQFYELSARIKLMPLPEVCF